MKSHLPSYSSQAQLNRRVRRQSSSHTTIPPRRSISSASSSPPPPPSSSPPPPPPPPPPVPPRYSHRPPLTSSRRLPSLQHHLNNSSYPPLTKDRLQRKNKLDALLWGRTTSSHRIPRRRSISNGYIFRHLYNEDNQPIVYNEPPSMQYSSRSTEASEDAYTSNHTSGDMGQSDSRSDIVGTSSHIPDAQRYMAGSEFTSTYQHSSVVGARVNASGLSSSRAPPHTSQQHYSSSRLQPTSNASSHMSDSRRQLSRLLKLTHTMNKVPTRPDALSNEKDMYSAAAAAAAAAMRASSVPVASQSCRQRIQAFLHGMAGRVVNTRSCEPSIDRIPMEEMVMLAHYLEKTAPTKRPSMSRYSVSTSGAHPPLNTSPTQRSSIFLDNDNNGSPDVATAHPLDHAATVSASELSQHHLGSLSNIFSHRHHSRKNTELSQAIIDERGPHRQSNGGNDIPQPSNTMDTCNRRRRSSPFQFLQSIPAAMHSFSRNNSHHHVKDEHNDTSHVPSIHFEGWSLWWFSPSHPLRVKLWKIVASSEFNIFILFLLFLQWIILSFVPIKVNADKTSFTHLYQYILLAINIIYTFEAIAKIIVYGLVISYPSKSRPKLLRLRHLFSTRKHDQRRTSSGSMGSARVPGFAAPVFSSARSVRSVSAINIPERVNADISGDEIPPPWSPINNNQPNVDPDTNNSLHPYSDFVSQYSPSSSPRNSSHCSPTSEHDLLGNIPSSTKTSKSLLEEEEKFLKVSHDAYLSRLGNIVDTVAIVSFWIDLFIMLFASGEETWSLFKALAAARILRLVVVTEGTAVIIQSLRTSFDMLCNVLGFFIFFWILFSLLGVFVFMNSFSRRCAVVDFQSNNVTLVEPPVACSNHYDANGIKSGVYDLESGIYVDLHDDDGVTCKLGQVCVQSVNYQPGWGYMSYDNILYTILNIFTVISTEGWTDLMYFSQDSISSVAAATFYCFCIYLMTYIMVPMFIAVITNSFASARGDMRHSAFAAGKKARLLLTRDITTNSQPDSTNEDWVYIGGAARNSYMGQIMRSRTDRIRVWANSIVSKRYFPIAGSVIVAINMVFMALYSAKLDDKDIQKIHLMNFLFTLLFAFEITLRILGASSWQQFWSFYRNRVDFFLAVGSMVCELPRIRDMYLLHRYLQVFAVLRCYRLVNLFPRVLNLLSNIIGDGQGIINLTFFTFWVLFLLCPISMQLFGGDFNTTTTVYDQEMRFDSFFQAFLALFQIMTGENWTDILYSAMHSQSHASAIYAGVYMVFLYFMVHYLVLNLFIAVIMENFDLDEDAIRHIQIKKYIRQHRWQPEYFKLDLVSQVMLPFFLKQERQTINVEKLPQTLVASVTRFEVRDFLTNIDPIGDDFRTSPLARGLQEMASARRSSRMTGRLSRLSFSVPRTSAAQGGGKRRSSIMSTVSAHSSVLTDEPTLDDPEEPLVKYGDEYEINVAKENKDVVLENLKVFRSVFFFKANNPLRKTCTRLVESFVYNTTIVFFLCTSVMLAIWDDATHRLGNPEWSYWAERYQRAMLVVFWIDSLIHIISRGVFVLPGSYLRSMWNVLDLLVLSGQTLVFLVVEKSHYRESLLRVLRTLRSMRLVYYVEDIRVIFLDLVHGLPSIIDAIALNTLVFVVFAMYGCYIFSDRFAACNDTDSIGAMSECHGEFKTDDLHILVPRVWDNPYQYSYDTFATSILHLFECASGEGWIMSLFTAMSVSPDLKAQPSFYWGSNSTWHALYYICFMFVISLCAIQLFIGVILETFKQRRGISSLTNTQRQFEDLQRQLSLIKPTRKATRPPSGSIRGLCYDIVIDKRGKFAKFMSLVLVLNIFTFSLSHNHQTEAFSSIQEHLYHVFLGLYIIEILLKMGGLGPRKWLSSKWNLYDGVMISTVLLLDVVKETAGINYFLGIIFKVALVGIPFRLAQRIESLDTLFRSVKRAMPRIIYITCALAVVMICFAIILEELFTTTRYGPYGNNHANFRNLPNTLQTLWRITTGENWDFLMHDFAVQFPNCVNDADCGSPVAAIAIFVVFYVVCTYVFVNLFTVVVINNFSFTFDNRNQFTLITRTDLRNFKHAWAEFDPKATGYIRRKDIPGFLRNLKGVLAMRIYEPEHSLKNLLEASNEMDADVAHLASVPVRRSITQAEPNIMGEGFYNFEEVNRRLSNMDVEAVRENKRHYDLVYQEIMLASNARGIAFHDMLEILAMRLVDVSKSLTFDALVHYARKQDKIVHMLAAKKAKSLVTMLVQRRQYLKERERMREHQLLDLGLLGGLLSPRAEEPEMDLQQKQHQQQYQRTRAASLPHSRAGSVCQIGGSPGLVPSIVVDQPHQPQPQPQPHLPAREPARLPSPSIESQVSSSTSLMPPRRGYHQHPEFSPEATFHEPLYDTSIDTFTRYYASDSNIDMQPHDAKTLVAQLENDPWSDMLKDQGIKENGA